MEVESKCRTVKVRLGPIRLRFNPVVSILSSVIIWAFSAWCMTYPTAARLELAKWTSWVTQKWTWLYIGTQDVWTVFIVVVYFSKYCKIKLGKDHEKPEFSDATYFTMLFAAGIGIGLFYFGVAEPIWHYAPGKHGNRYWGRYTDNQRAQDAMNLTYFHWGVHAWIVYALIGLLLGFVAHRNGLPMTMRSCFYPLLGNKVFGTAGDLIDTLSIICTMFGVCTSLGLGVFQVVGGLRRINNQIEETLQNHIIAIWGITVVATASVVSGLKLGIRRLSEVCFAIGMLLMLVVFFYDDTWYMLNLYVQSCGNYLQWIVQLGFHTDAFAQLGNAPDGKEVSNWMNSWTIFYWGWWIAWSPYVGMFIAKISKGRTIREFINYTLTLPILYTFLWFAVFGGAALKMERDATIAGINCNSTLGGAASSQSDNGLYRLSCRGKNDMWFDVIYQYGNLGGFLSAISLISIVLYFVTSSDSGSLVIDCLSANGDPNPPVTQRVFWALTEGAVATALLCAGGSDALTALQAVSITSGLLYTIILNFMCVSLWRALRVEAGDLDPNGPGFSTGLLDPLYKPSSSRVSKTLVAVLVPWWPLGKAAGRLYNSNSCCYMVIVAVPFYMWIVLEVLQVIDTGLAYLGWAIYIGFVSYSTGIRSNMRQKYNINGNLAEDFFALLFLYPLAVVQMADHMEFSQLMEKDAESAQGVAAREALAMEALLEKDPEKENGVSATPQAAEWS